jgi:hypothetical protein
MIAINFDPIARGYVSSLARPGRNVTGIFVRQLDLDHAMNAATASGASDVLSDRTWS